MVGLEEAKAISAQAVREYRTRRATAERHVAKWVWATGPLYGLTPFEPECFQFSRGHPLKSVPKRKTNMDSFGFDDAGRLCVVRIGGKKGVDREKFYVWRTNSFVEGVCYGGADPNGVYVDLLHVRLYDLRSGVVHRSVTAAVGTWSTSEFECEEGLVRGIVYKGSAESTAREYFVRRDGSGRVVRIETPARVAWEPAANFRQEWLVRPGESARS